MIKYGIKPYISEKNTRVVSVQYEFNFYTNQPLWKNIKSVKKYQEIKKRSNEYKNKIIIDHEFSFDMYQSQFEVVGLTFNVNLILIRQQKVAKFSSKLFYCMA